MRFLSYLLNKPLPAFALVCALLLSPIAFAGSTGNVKIPTIESRGLVASHSEQHTPGAGYSTVSVAVFWVADDTNVNEVTEVAIDTGTEACAVYNMTCLDTYVFAVAGGSGDEFTDSACATDQADTTIAMSFCY